jgi:hypothetical protein
MFTLKFRNTRGHNFFPNCKKHLKRRKCSSTGEATLTLHMWLSAQPEELFLDELKMLEH